jgi:hypothetical protein
MSYIASTRDHLHHIKHRDIERIPPAAAMQGWLNKQSHGVIKKSQRHWFELWGPELR